MVSAKNQTQSVVDGFDLGCNDWIHKPFNRQELVTRITYQLRCSVHRRLLQDALSQGGQVKSPLQLTPMTVNSSVLFVSLAGSVGKVNQRVQYNLFETFYELSHKHEIERFE